MADLVFKISPDIILGSYCASRIGTFAKERGSRFMLVLDPVLKAQATTNAITESLTSRDVEFFVFDTANRLRLYTRTYQPIFDAISTQFILKTVSCRLQLI